MVGVALTTVMGKLAYPVRPEGLVAEQPTSVVPTGSTVPDCGLQLAG